MIQDDVAFRLLRSDDVPATNPRQLAFEFGLQDVNQQITPGVRGADGAFVFDFSLTVRPDKKDGRPSFTGRFASGTPQDRLVYLSWRAVNHSDYINRIKARLSSIDWALIRTSQDSGRPMVADLTGWLPGDRRKFVEWSLRVGD